ncbi:CLUMA_CG012357, isoform A [Clunio marinus]|uniref:CLUMA_CG012357, isoform A n=1 Tax=Clunio marinus TaxID=568069 RepID=A0A1J1IHR3_9DIPT|nr:CLUMA_CG012357, isoform A [Clunio marinus]
MGWDNLSDIFVSGSHYNEYGIQHAAILFGACGLFCVIMTKALLKYQQIQIVSITQERKQ